VRRPALRRTLVALSVGLASCLAVAGVARPRLERAVRSHLEREAAQHGLAAQAEAVRVRLWPPLFLEGLQLEKPGAWRLAAERLEAAPRLRGRGLRGRLRLSVSPATLSTPWGLALETAPTVWDLAAAPDGGLGLEMLEPVTGLSLRRDGMDLLDAGVVGGTLRLASASEGATFEAYLQARGLRLAVLSGPGDGETSAFGPPADAALQLAGSWLPARGLLEVPRWRLTTDGAALSGSLSLADLPRDPRLKLSLEVERLDFARLLRASGLDPPEAASAGGARREADLGSASLSARMVGRLADPSSFTVSQRLDFDPPRRALPTLESLRGDFVHEVTLPGGGRKWIPVSPDSPGFVALRDVPPLFVQTLLLGEDSGFFGHHGIDLSELPSAVLTNWSRGGSARGASTLTQQLAKNLFLSREKRLGRKLQELCLALLLEATLDKERILEIYLNVIEWGPGLHGLRPAARHYFGVEPQKLTPAQMAFLVALIPGPSKHQRSLAGGSPSPGFRALVNGLLAKLQSAGALDEEQLQAALADELLLRTAGDPP
jgi:hypothetical protein